MSMQRNKNTEPVAPNSPTPQLSRRRMLSTLPASFWLGAGMIQARAATSQRGATPQQPGICADFKGEITPQVVKNVKDCSLVHSDMATIEKLAANTKLAQMGVNHMPIDIYLRVVRRNDGTGYIVDEVRDPSQ